MGTTEFAAGAGSVQGLRALGFDWLPEHTSYQPGQPIRFAWSLAWLRLNAQDSGQASVDWATADIELRLSATDEVLWRRTGFRWPPPAEVGYVVQHEPSGQIQIVPTAWPPAGYTTEGPLVPTTDSARRDLYNGFGEKPLELRLTGHGPSSGSYSAAHSIWVEPEPSRSFVLAAPSFVEIGQAFIVTGAAANDHGYAAVDVRATATQQNTHDGASEDFEPVEIDVFPHAGATATVAAPLPLTWEWVDKPTYHVHRDDLERDLRYTGRATWVDEFGNPYSPLIPPGIVVRVRVSDTKVSAADTAEAFFWTNVGIVIVVAVVGAVLTVASAGLAGPAAGAGAAGLALGLGLAQGSVSAVGAAGGAAASYGYSGWAAIADDPPVPDPAYWRSDVPLGTLPAVTRELEPLAAYATNFGQLGRASDLILGTSALQGRILGAAASGVQDAVEARKVNLQRLRTELTDAAATISETADLAAAEIEKLGVGRKQMQEAIAELRNRGLSEEQRAQLIGFGVSAGAVKQLEAAVKTPEIEQVEDISRLLRWLHANALSTIEASLVESRVWTLTASTP